MRNRPEWRPEGFHGQLSHDIIYAEDWNAELNPKDHEEEPDEEEEEEETK